MSLEFAGQIAAAAQSSRDLFTFTEKYCSLIHSSALDDETIKALYRIGVNFLDPRELPNLAVLGWKEAIIQCKMAAAIPEFHPVMAATIAVSHPVMAAAIPESLPLMAITMPEPSVKMAATESEPFVQSNSPLCPEVNTFLVLSPEATPFFVLSPEVTPFLVPSPESVPVP